MPESEISPSLNEVASLAKRAVRGAGMSWGIAEEAASSVRWLTAHKLAGPALLARLLKKQAPRDNTSMSPATGSQGLTRKAHHTCPLLAAAEFSDTSAIWAHSKDACTEIPDLAYPLLMLPTIARVALRAGVWLQVSWDDMLISTDGQSVCIQGSLTMLTTEKTRQFRCVVADTMKSVPQTTQRQSVDKESWDLLESFAQRSYAPATEESRRLGAGGD
ncbi:MAG: DUF3726 domain-containing protein [Granulosicoccus sp.]